MMVVACAMSIFDAEPVSRLFGFIECFAVVALVVCFLWHEIGRVYPTERVRRRRVYAVISGLSCLVVAPLMVLLLTSQFITTYRLYSASLGPRTLAEKLKDDRTACYVISVACIWIVTPIVVYAGYIGP